MTARRPPAKSGINWPALNFALALGLASVTGVVAYFTFNSTIVSDVAKAQGDIRVLESQVSDLRANQRDLMQEQREREQRPDRP